MGHLGVLRGPEGLEGPEMDPFEDPFWTPFRGI